VRIIVDPCGGARNRRRHHSRDGGHRFIDLGSSASSDGCASAVFRRRCRRIGPLEGGAKAGVHLLQSVLARAVLIAFYMGGLHDVAREAFEAKESGESNGTGGRWGLVAGGKRMRGSRWSAGRYTDGEHGNYSR
jgi:hypothetical protein